MTDIATRDPHSSASRVFAGLEPNHPPVSPAPNKAALRTVPLLVAGSMAAATIGMTGSVTPVHADPAPNERPAPSAFGKSIRSAVAAATAAVKAATAEFARTTTTAPPTYTVQAGDTVSDIATRFGLPTASVLALNGLSWSSLIFPGQVLTLTNGSALPSTPHADPAPIDKYTIAPGDTISGIADRFGVSTLSILTANGLGWSSIIYPGQSIVIPGVEAPGSLVAESAPLVEAVEPAPEPAPAPVPEAAPPAPPAVEGVRYTIVSGDTLSGIAAKFGIDTQSLLDANGLSWDSVIFGGDVIVIPGGIQAESVSATSSTMSEEMRGNAAVIVQVGRELGVSDYGIVIALATAMQESSLRNLDWGDRDSVGLFQQRPSTGWGTVEQLTTPWYAARLFYGGPSNPNAGATRGLLDIPGWESMPLTVAAQAVQISAYPDAYAKWESSAWQWLAELGL